MLKRILVQSGVQMDIKPSSKSASYPVMAGRLYTQSKSSTQYVLRVKFCPSRIHNSIINARSLRPARATSSFLLLDFVRNLWVHSYDSFD